MVEKKTKTLSPRQIWRPSLQAAAETALDSFCKRCTPFSKGAPRSKEDYDALLRWSTDKAEDFWLAVWRFAEVEGHTGDAPFIQRGATIRETQFFPAAQMNFAENLLRGKKADDEEIVVASWLEQGEPRTLTRRELRNKVEALARLLKRLGVQPLDRVAAVLPNGIEALVGMLAAVAQGAVWTSASPDFGVQSLLDRFAQTRPKVLLLADGYAYGGKFFDRRAEMEKVVQGLPSIESVLATAHSRRCGVLDINFANSFSNPCSNPRSNPSPNHRNGAKGGDGKATWYSLDEALQEQEQEQASASSYPHPYAYAYRPLPFDHPLFILYSSGTTGAPKCIVHRAGGVLLKHISEQMFHADIRAGDRVFFFTTCGWMMWNWLASALFCRACIVLYDGAPMFDQGRRLWQMAEREKLTHFGASAKYYAALQQSGLVPREQFSTENLRASISTGSPLAPEGFDFIASALSVSQPFPSSISGGTDICGCFVMGCPSMPVARGEISVSVLGMASEVVDDKGQRLFDRQGELVCSAPFPSMPLAFFGDDAEQSLYRRTYFDSFAARDLWHQGDYASQNSASGGFALFGRSDATLNVGGVRIGTAEIYRQVESMHEVAEAVAVEQTLLDASTRLLLFVKIAQGCSLNDRLRNSIRQRLRENCSPRHVPQRIFAVGDIPRTRNGKITETAIRDFIAGKTINNRGAIANPQALQAFRDIVVADQNSARK